MNFIPIALGEEDGWGNPPQAMITVLPALDLQADLRHRASAASSMAYLELHRRPFGFRQIFRHIADFQQ